MLFGQRLCLILSIIATCFNFARAIPQLRAIDVLNSLQQQRKQETHLETTNQLKGKYDKVQELYIEQQLDHFSEKDNRTFQQRYFYSDAYTRAINRTNAPVYAFLCVGGEGPSLTKAVLVDSVHCSGDMVELARRLHERQQASVHLFALEHRYYGKSYPKFKDKNGNSTSPVLNKNLVYLSSKQALADLAFFVETLNVKTVTFGGSYPGMLAAWARLEYPHLVHAAVSNSAPIQAQVDFPQYNERVAYDLQYPLVGGSSACLQTVMDGHEAIVEAIEQGYHEEIAALFNVCDADSLLDRKNVDLFVGDGVIGIPAQSNDPRCESELCSIEKLCSNIVQLRNHSSALEVLATIAKMQNDGLDCTKVDWNATVSYYASPNSQMFGMRSWLWQTCNEFGFYQTCETDSLCPYARGYHTLESDFEICEKAFGVPREKVVDNVKKSLKRYGGWNMNATRILSVNGDVDPWSMLALTNNRGDGLPTHWVKGASHHYWTHTVKDTDGQEIMDARDIIYLKVMQWLEEGNSEGDASVELKQE